MKKNEFVIPTSFECGFRTNQVYYDDQLIYSEKAPSVGSNSLGMGNIYMQVPVENQLDEQAIQQAFVHELTHSILFGMGEETLCHDERFVDGFANLLFQFMLTKKGDLLEEWKKDLEKEKKKKEKKKKDSAKSL